MRPFNVNILIKENYSIQKLLTNNLVKIEKVLNAWLQRSNIENLDVHSLNVWVSLHFCA